MVYLILNCVDPMSVTTFRSNW